MSFTSETRVSTPVERYAEHCDASVPAPHIEETPCMIMTAVAVEPTVNVRLWQARTARTWMT